jgi:hypothetical protein
MARPFTGQSSLEAVRIARDMARTAAELRNRAKSTVQAQAAALDVALAGAAEGAVLVIPGIKEKIEAHWATAFPCPGCTACSHVMAGARARPVFPAVAHPGSVSGRGALCPY